MGTGQKFKIGYPQILMVHKPNMSKIHIADQIEGHPTASDVSGAVLYTAIFWMFPLDLAYVR